MPKADVVSRGSLALLPLVIASTWACRDEPGRPADSSVQAAAGTAAASGDVRMTDRGLYRVGLRAAEQPIPLGRIHSWYLQVEQADGAAFEPVRVSVDGGMPQHGHGFVTRPRVTGRLSDGSFVVEGVKFHMPGAWVMRVELAGAPGPDTASIDVQVGP